MDMKRRVELMMRKEEKENLPIEYEDDLSDDPCQYRVSGNENKNRTEK